MSPPGTKKLVPAWRSSISIVSATSRMLNASRIKIDVTNQAQQVRGIRIQVMPGARYLSVVAKKLIALISDDKQNKPILISQRSVPGPCPGPAEARALSGGYCVQPAPEGPPGAKNAAMSTKKETRAVQNPSAVSLGKAIREEPNCSGRKYVPNPLCGTSESTKKTINVPCMVKYAR